MEDTSKLITVVVSFIMASIVTIGAIKNKDNRQNSILKRAIKKTEYKSVACYCVDTIRDRTITKASMLQRATCVKKFNSSSNAKERCDADRSNEKENTAELN